MKGLCAEVDVLGWDIKTLLLSSMLNHFHFGLDYKWGYWVTTTGVVDTGPTILTNSHVTNRGCLWICWNTLLNSFPLRGFFCNATHHFPWFSASLSSCILMIKSVGTEFWFLASHLSRFDIKYRRWWNLFFLTPEDYCHIPNRNIWLRDIVQN